MATEEPVPIQNITLEDSGNSTIDIFYFYYVEQLTFLWILFFTIVFGNSYVLYTLFSSKKKSRMNFFMKHLAIADLLVGFISVLTDIGWKMTIEWEAGYIGCKAIRYMQVVVTYLSTYMLVTISIDRYDAITRPLRLATSWHFSRVMVALAWGLSALFGAPLLYLCDYVYFEEDDMWQCWIDLGSSSNWQVYMLLVSVTLFILPACIIIICYTIIVFTIWKKSRSMGSNRHRCMSGLEELPSRRASSRGVIPKAKVKTVKMTITIISVFLLLWAPYIVYDLLQVFGHFDKTQTNIAISTFIQSLSPLNSAANPFIYCFFSNDTCKTIRRKTASKKYLKCCGCNTEQEQETSVFTRYSSVPNSSRQTLRSSTGNPQALRSYVRYQCSTRSTVDGDQISERLINSRRQVQFNREETAV